MELIGRYVNIEGEMHFFRQESNQGHPLLEAAFKWIRAAEDDALAQARNQMRNLPGSEGVDWLLSVDDNPTRDAILESRKAEGKAEAARRGSIAFGQDATGMTWDSASYDSGIVKVTIDEALFRSTFPHLFAGDFTQACRKELVPLVTKSLEYTDLMTVLLAEVGRIAEQAADSDSMKHRAYLGEVVKMLRDRALKLDLEAGDLLAQSRAVAKSHGCSLGGRPRLRELFDVPAPVQDGDLGRYRVIKFHAGPKPRPAMQISHESVRGRAQQVARAYNGGCCDMFARANDFAFAFGGVYLEKMPDGPFAAIWDAQERVWLDDRLRVEFDSEQARLTALAGSLIDI